MWLVEVAGLEQRSDGELHGRMGSEKSTSVAVLQWRSESE